MPNDEPTPIFDKTVFSYSRARAIKDGFLIDITVVADKIGFKIPIAVTRAVWNKYIAWINDNKQKLTRQDLDNHLQNMLITLRIALKKAQNAACIFYEWNLPQTNTIQLKAIFGEDENGEAVLTIMLSDEN